MKLLQSELVKSSVIFFFFLGTKFPVCLLAEPRWRDTSWQLHVGLQPAHNTSNKSSLILQDEDNHLIWLLRLLQLQLITAFASRTV